MLLILILFSVLYCFLLFFFFFQAEDGIRDKLVTGVQTCALPISIFGFRTSWVRAEGSFLCSLSSRFSGRGGGVGSPPRRSEERRVGKECRSRWSPYH